MEAREKYEQISGESWKGMALLLAVMVVKDIFPTALAFDLLAYLGTARKASSSHLRQPVSIYEMEANLSIY
ncbi:MAG: hypothetical protein P8Y63_03470, partial [Deltaproteobacteria bacterium]